MFGPTPAKFQPLARHLLATLLYHSDFHSKIIPKSSRFRQSTAFHLSIYKNVRPAVSVCYPWKNLEGIWKVNFTGITPLALMFQQFEVQKEKLDSNKTELIQKLEKILHEHTEFSGLGNGISLASLEQHILFPLLQHFSQISTHKDASDGNSGIEKYQELTVNDVLFAPHSMDFELPTKCSACDAWVNWHHGEERLNKKGQSFQTVPWSTLKESDLKPKGTTSSMTKRNVTARQHLYYLKFMCKQFNSVTGIGTRAPTIAHIKELYQGEEIAQILPKNKTLTGKTKRRINQLTWLTIARYMKTSGRKKKKIGELIVKHNKISPSVFSVATRNQTQSKIVSVASKQCKGSIHKISVVNNGYNFEGIIGVTQNKKSPTSRRFDSRTRSSTNTFNCKGPNPQDEDAGHCKISSYDLQKLNPKELICSAITTAYLNLLANVFYDQGVRRSEPDLVPMLKYHIQDSGFHQALESYATTMSEIQSGSMYLDWERDKLILFQIFSGDINCGHWSLLVLDRTRGEGNHMAVYFDSLPSSPGLELTLQGDFLKVGIIDKASRWITARVPKQAKGSLDCGAFMCCTASAYTMALEKAGLLCNQGQQREVQQPTIQAVELFLHFDAQEWGRHAREHIADTIKKEMFEKEKAIGGTEVVFLY